MPNFLEKEPKYPTNIALVDCNNFYVSCERLFRPDLAAKPIAVLSNNDGCIVARSQEVKALGIKMAEPVHKIHHLIQQHNIQLFSSNYALYADLSARVMHSLSAFSPHIEVYSIDEAFLDIDRHQLNRLEVGREIKKSISRWVGIPVSVGIAPTKTLAKLANYAAKKWLKSGGVVDLTPLIMRKKVLQACQVNEVWGVGKRLSEKLRARGIRTAWSLQNQSLAGIQKQFNITLAQTVQELQGVPAIPFIKKKVKKKQIICSRSFKQRLTKEDDLQQALSVFCLRAAEKLRIQRGLARKVTIFIRTSPFDNQPFYQNSSSYVLKAATQDSTRLVKIVKYLLHQLYKPNYQYQQAGVVLGNIQSSDTAEGEQIELFSNTRNTRSDVLMKTIDCINQRFPNNLSLGATGNRKLWQSIPINQSPRYTTDWKDLSTVKIIL